ncbi:MAG: hypothetical protein MJ237_05260 [bacterium]|nr:hypothetical protein [bacterium]
MPTLTIPQGMSTAKRAALSPKIYVHNSPHNPLVSRNNITTTLIFDHITDAFYSNYRKSTSKACHLSVYKSLMGCLISETGENWTFCINPLVNLSCLQKICTTRITNMYEMLVNNCNNMWGVLFGGQAKEPALYNSVAEIFDKINIPKTLLLGKLNEEPDGFYIDSNRIFLNVNTGNSANISDDKSQPNMVNFLKNYYEVTEIDDKIKLSPENMLPTWVIK